MNKYCLILLAFMAAPVWPESLKDPRTRDEDISATTITARVDRPDTANYLYTYTVTSPSNNLNDIADMEWDVFCPLMPNAGKQDISDAGMTRDFDSSRDGRHVPLVSELVGFEQKVAGFYPNNWFSSGIFLGPGGSRAVTLLSPNKPGYLHFRLNPSSIHERDYDYAEVDWGPDTDLPFDEDWEVHGLVKGPVCAGDEATPMTRPIFNGQKMPGELREINELLRYEVAGNRNRWHAPATQTEVKIRVYYGYSIDATTFTATLNGRDIKSLFHPGPYDNEWVTLPLEGARTEIKLSVLPKAGLYEDGERFPIREDIDPFEIRRPLPATP